MAILGRTFSVSFLACAALAASSVLFAGCSSAAEDLSEGDGLALAEDGLTASDVQIVGELQPAVDPAPIAYSYPTRYRALRITSMTSIEELELEITAEGGMPQAWIVDAGFRSIVSSTTVGVGARLQWQRTSITTTRTYYLLLRESTLKKTVFHIRHTCPNPKPPACTPTTCAAQGSTCGSISDGCGGTLECGTCGTGSTCTANKCVVAAPSSCKSPYSGASIPEGGLCNWAEENANQGHPEGICTRGSCHQGCFIDGKYYYVGQQNPANPCQICDPTASTPTRVGWSDVKFGYESSYPSCTACVDYQGKRTVPSGAACYNFQLGRSGTCSAGKCN